MRALAVLVYSVLALRTLEPPLAADSCSLSRGARTALAVSVEKQLLLIKQILASQLWLYTFGWPILVVPVCVEVS